MSRERIIKGYTGKVFFSEIEIGLSDKKLINK